MPKKPEYIKTPGFVIEVPKDRRKGFFVAPKSPLVYWAFKNRPRVFISEKLIFTFGGKPVAEALVAKVEGPGKGEGEYQKWHKVYWKPVTFKRFRVAGRNDPAKKIFNILAEAQLEGFGGKCFAAAIAINRVLFGGKGKLVAAFNKAFLAQGRLKGHVAVKFNGRYWDAEGETSLEDIESWGMLDPHDQDYIDEYDGDWNEQTAEEVIVKEISDHVTGGYGELIPEYEKRLKDAAAKFSKTADHDLETDSGETYWAGTGNAASGILPVCPQKGTVCLAWRSQYVQSPDCWGTIGGAVQRGKSPQQSAKAELAEETGYTGGISLTPAYIFTDGGFTYHNYIGVVGSEFTFSPKPLSKEEHMVLMSKLRPEQYHQLIPGWETDHIWWAKYETVLDDMNENPEDYHPGMLKLFKNSKDAIERALGIKPEEEKPQEPQEEKQAGNMLPTAQPPDVRVLPCPTGKKKYFDKATVLMKARGLQGTEAMAYQCPKCHWWHMTSKPQHGPNPTYRNAAEQGHLFPSSQDAKFRQWFDGSKVVDQQGRPMPVFHGTRSSVNFDTFAVDGPPQAEDSYEGENTSSGSGWDPTAFMGAHFAEEPRVANQFAQGEGWTKSRYEGESEAPRVIEVFLRITHPKDFGTESNLHNFICQGRISDDDVLGIGCRVETGYNPWEGDEQDNPEAQKEIEAYYQKYENDQAFRTKENEFLLQQYRPMDMEDDMLRNAAYDLAMQARHKLEQSGVDGIRYKNEIEGGHAWIAFAPQQIKGVYSQFNPQDQRFTASDEKEADWKRNVLLPAALTLGLGAPSTSPNEINPQQQQIQTQRRREAEAEKARQEQIDKLIEAISRAEGAKPERNNPGNIADFNTGEIKTFDSLEEGKDALADQLNRIADGVHPFIKPEMTLRQAGLIYSNGDPNWAHNVSLIMHVPQSTKMGDLINGVTQQADTDTRPQPSGRTGAWLKKAAGFAFRSFKKLWHVGDMNPKSKQPGSLEGSGLSVSIHPEEWKEIAEIGGATWELVKAGNKFLNFHRLSKAQRKQITAWGVQNGFVEEVAIGWRWVYFDSEAEEERYMEFATEQEAREEMEGQGEGEVVPAKGSSMKGTEKLKQRTKNPRADDMVVAFDLLVTVYAEDELDCDGVWWEDTFDPAGLSAPRGVIFVGKLSSWKARKIQSASKTAGEIWLYHGTSKAALKQILQEGKVKAISNWGSWNVAKNWAADIRQSNVVIGIPISRFDQNHLSPDEEARVGLLVPKDYDDAYEEWSGSAKTWKDSLRIYEAVEYDIDMPVSSTDVVAPGHYDDTDYADERHTARKIAADRSWTREQAEELLEKLPLAECGYSARIVGSIATKGQSDHDLDILLTPTSEDFDFERLLKYFELIGASSQPTYNGDEEIWEVRLPSGRVVDFFFPQE